MICTLTLATVLLWGDSTCATGDGITSIYWKLRGDCPAATIFNGCAAGRSTTQPTLAAQEQAFRDKLAFAGYPAVVIVGPLGVNDRQYGATPEDTARNLGRLAAIARDNGATPVLVTPFPDTNNVVDTAAMARLRTLIVALGAATGTRVIDMAAAFPVENWWACTTDGVHPNDPTSGGACRQLAADYIAGRLP